MFLYPSVPVDFNRLLDFHNLSTEPGDQSVVLGKDFVQRFRHFLLNAGEEGSSLSNGGHPAVPTGSLVNELDTLLANRLKNASATCWPFVREFLPRSQLRILQKCTVGKSPKCKVRLWLKSSVLDKSLFSLLSSFLAASETRKKFYQDRALMRQDEVLEEISILILDIAVVPQQMTGQNESCKTSFGSLDHEVVVRDRRRCTLNTERLAPAEIGIDSLAYCLTERTKDTVTPSNNRQSHLGRKVKISAPKIDDERSISFDSTLLDFDSSGIGNSLMEHCNLENEKLSKPLRSHRVAEEKVSAHHRLSSDNGVASNEHEDLDIVFSIMNSYTSDANVDSSQNCSDCEAVNDMESVGSFGNLTTVGVGPVSGKEQCNYTDRIMHHLESVSDVLASYSEAIRDRDGSDSVEIDSACVSKFRPPVAQSTMANMEDGEIMLESGQLVELAVHVFVEGTEQFYKMFRFHQEHSKGVQKIRYLVLTSQAVYVVAREVLTADSMPSFVRQFNCSFHQLDRVSVGLGSQSVVFHTSPNKNETVICTCSHQLTRAILCALEVSIRRCMSTVESVPPVVVDNTRQKCTISKWISSELSSINLPVFNYSLVYWYSNVEQSGRNYSSQQCGRMGFLYFRKVPKFRVWPLAESWTQDYFILRGQKLYQFEDSSCKAGKYVYNLKEDVSVCRQMENEDYGLSFELVINGESSSVQFACATKTETLQWMNSIILCTSKAEPDDDDSCLACCCVLTDGYIFIGQETDIVDFVRTLAYAELSSIETSTILAEQNILLLKVECSVEDFRGQWLISFAAEYELQTFVKCLMKQMPHITFVSPKELSADIFEKCLSVRKRWTAF